MEEKVISVATSKVKVYFRCIPIAEERLGENSAVLETKGTIPDGEVIEFYTNLKCVKHYKSGRLHGSLKMQDILSGKVTLREEYENGELKDIVDTGTMAPLSPKEMHELKSQVEDRGITFVRQKEGLVFFNKDEQIAKETLDAKGEQILIEGAIPDGIVKEYDDNGIVKTEASYKNNKLEGATKRYDEQGNILSKENYENGELSGEAFYYDYYNGKQIVEKMIYKKGLIDGKRETFYPNDVLHITEVYSEDKLQGKREVYYDTGILNLEENYKHGKLSGLRVFYHYNGALWYKETYIGGMLEGERLCYFPSGEIQMKEKYAKGLLEGEKAVFDKDGNVVFKEEYAMGSPVKKRRKHMGA